jgi:hypothetical protein
VENPMIVKVNKNNVTVHFSLRRHPGLFPILKKQMQRYMKNSSNFNFAAYPG